MKDTLQNYRIFFVYNLLYKETHIIILNYLHLLYVANYLFLKGACP